MFQIDVRTLRRQCHRLLPWRLNQNGYRHDRRRTIGASRLLVAISIDDRFRSVPTDHSLHGNLDGKDRRNRTCDAEGYGRDAGKSGNPQGWISTSGKPDDQCAHDDTRADHATDAAKHREVQIPQKTIIIIHRSRRIRCSLTRG